MFYDHEIHVNRRLPVVCEPENLYRVTSNVVKRAPTQNLSRRGIEKINVQIILRPWDTTRRKGRRVPLEAENDASKSGDGDALEMICAAAGIEIVCDAAEEGRRTESRGESAVRKKITG